MRRRGFITGSIAAAILPGASAFAQATKRIGEGRALDWRMPAEEGAHQRTFMQWPVNKAVYDDPDFLFDLQGAVARVANAISQFEPVVLLMDAAHEKAARRRLAKGVEIWPIPTDDLWCRDSGPTFVVNDARKLAIAHLRFNGWGNKQIHTHDGVIAEKLAARLGLPILPTGLVGEQGGVETDGAGTLLAHESSWVNANRNTIDRGEIEARLLAALGAQKMIWAPGVKDADITDYHIDALARFVRPGVIVIQLSDRPDPEDPWSRSAFETFDILKRATDYQGRPFEIVRLPEPRKPRVKASDFVASYVNYYVCNGAVITAQFGDPGTDREAVGILKRLYPGREVVAVNVDAIGEVGGGIHCATQQQPLI